MLFGLAEFEAPLDDLGGVGPGEFFAVAQEVLFEPPGIDGEAEDAEVFLSGGGLVADFDGGKGAGIGEVAYLLVRDAEGVGGFDGGDVRAGVAEVQRGTGELGGRVL